MKKLQKKRRTIALRPLLGAMLMASGLFQLAVPTFGITAAGQAINNTATAEYDDDNDPNNGTINSTSNTVNITVAEVAGMTAVSGGITDVNGGSVNTNDVIAYDFILTNTGNDPTRFSLPGENGVVIPTNNASFDFTGSNTPAPTSGVQITAVNGTPLPAPIDVPAAGATTDTLGLANGGEFDSGDTLTVRVNVKVTETTATAPITVQYGDTAPNDNSPATQNQPVTAATAPAQDVTTVDLVDPSVNPNEVAGTPVNGEREAAVTQTTNLSTQVRNLALAKLLKVASNVNDSGTPTTAQDDVVTYDLTLSVESTDPSGTFTPGSLTGTQVQVNGVVQNNIVLVSDVIPTGTVYDSTNEATLAPPAGWTRVYATQDPNNWTPIVVNGNQTGATNWVTTIPADVTTITRIGFIYDVTAGGNSPIAPGTVVGGGPGPSFQFQVVTSGLATSGGTLNNIAQAFGDTLDPNAPAGNPTQGLGTVVYDESGDQNPNNFNDNNTPPSPEGTTYDSAVDTGIANPVADGVDPSNNNSGTGPKGEDTQTNVVATPSNVSGIFNGPNGQPQAIGPTDNNDDFINLSTADNPANDSGPFDPTGVDFTNTVQNPSTNATQLDQVVIQPLAPSAAQAATGGPANQFGADTDIPDGTQVTITFGPAGPTQQVAVYDYTAAGGFTLNAGLSQNVPNGEIEVGTLAVGESQNYTVTVDPPAGTAQNVAIPVPIVAFPENTPSSGFDPVSDSVFNVSVDRLYTGYLTLVKEARLLDANGLPAAGADGQFSQNPTFRPQPDQIIEYRVTYTNISEGVVGSGNSGLNANNVVVTENGTLANSNWALDNDTNGEIDTSNVIGSIQASQGTTTPVANSATDISGTTSASDVPVYTNNVGTVAPQGTGTVIFQRRVNNSGIASN